MVAGYVLDFSNRTFQEFISDCTGHDIYDQKYSAKGESKANRLRSFWQSEPNHLVGKVLNEMIDYCKANKSALPEFEECRRIAQRLLLDASVQDIEAITPNADGKDFEALAKTVKESIEKNQPELGLDRLHTFVVKYVRVLCKKYEIQVDREKALHAAFGEYIKHVKKTGLIESEMTERILKSSISILEAFNHVRNNQSLAHDNPTLNYNESLLIFNNVCSSIRFISALESSTSSIKQTAQVEQDEVPF